MERIINGEAGQAVNCYNLAAGGVTASEAGLLSEIIMDTYDPVLIVYGISARDVSGAFGQDVSDALLDSAWIQYWLGNPSPGGWLGHHSEAYGQILGVVGWYKHLFQDWQHSYKEEIPTEVRLRVDFVEDARLYDLKALVPSESDLAGLDQVLALREQGVTVILVEMPFYEGALEPVFGGYENYADRFLAPMDTYTEVNDVVFIHSTPFTLVDENDWTDWEHLNESGQQIFSEWLGEQIVDGIAEGKITIQAHQYAAD
ncbi:MAG: hypothetical protein JXJ17_06275 [Anaerolineae bacterium]|nr:hypothetical protein [Anaerolineae bacterium]